MAQQLMPIRPTEHQAGRHDRQGTLVLSVCLLPFGVVTPWSASRGRSSNSPKRCAQGATFIRDQRRWYLTVDTHADAVTTKDGKQRWPVLTGPQDR